MRTREEVLDGVYDKTHDSQDGYSQSTALKAMDSYAKEMCIAYGHWIFKRLGYVHDDKPPQDESEQLLNHFLKSINSKA